jgi:hypothetical protein
MQGYGLLCVGYALSDLEVETQDEDEVIFLGSVAFGDKVVMFFDVVPLFVVK